MQQAPKHATPPSPAHRRLCTLVWLLLVSTVFLSAQPKTVSVPASRHVIDRSVVLSDSQPRRITLPPMTAGAEIRITVESRPARKSQDAAPVQVEILRVVGAADQVPDNLQQATLHSVLLARTPLAGDMVYRSSTGGNYLVALRRPDDFSEPVIARTRIQVDRKSVV